LFGLRISHVIANARFKRLLKIWNHRSS
jgi:hypothetical protein